MLNRSQIISITLCVIVLATLLIGIYNSVIYQNVSNNLATGSLVNASDATAVDTSTATSTSTTTAIATSIATDVFTTNPPEGCRRMLPFGPEVGDLMNPLADVVNPLSSCVIWNITTTSEVIHMITNRGRVALGEDVTIYIDGIYGLYDTEWSAFYRQVFSKKEKDAIACLVKNVDTVEAWVYTWFKNATQENEEIQTFQIIIASLGHSATYIIRIYSDNLPSSSEPTPVRIRFVEYGKYFEDLKPEDVRGQRQIFDITYPVAEGKNLTVVEEGKNCPILC